MLFFEGLELVRVPKLEYVMTHVTTLHEQGLVRIGVK